jgi:glucan-binding YG repeat protein
MKKRNLFAVMAASAFLLFPFAIQADEQEGDAAAIVSNQDLSEEEQKEPQLQVLLAKEELEQKSKESLSVSGSTQNVTYELKEDGSLYLECLEEIDETFWDETEGILSRDQIQNLVISSSASSFTIGCRAFAGCNNLLSVSMPEQTIMLGNMAFYECEKLESIVLPEGLAILEEQAFSRCTSLKNMDIPSTVKEIGVLAMDGCASLENVSLHEGLQSIGSGAFSYCRQLKSVQIPESVKTIGDLAFEEDTLLESMYLPENATDLGDGLFFNCSSLKTVSIPQSAASIGSSTFLGCSSLTDIVIPENVKRIGACAFKECSSLSELILPASLEQVQEDAFINCPNLKIILALSQEVNLENTYDPAVTCVYQAGKTQNGWVKLKDKAYYFQNGQLVKDDTIEIDGIFYDFDENGELETGWHTYGMYTYYLYEQGNFALGPNEINETDYLFDKNGQLCEDGLYTYEGILYETDEYGRIINQTKAPSQDGWFDYNGSLLYFSNGKVAAASLIEIDGFTYYFDSYGKILKGEFLLWLEKDDMKTFYFDADGHRVSGWKEIDGQTYYFGIDSAMHTGWIDVEGNTYYLDENGVLQTGFFSDENGQYYLDPENGGAKTVLAVKKIGDKTYYFDQDGKVTSASKYAAAKLKASVIKTAAKAVWNVLNKLKYLLSKFR